MQRMMACDDADERLAGVLQLLGSLQAEGKDKVEDNRARLERFAEHVHVAPDVLCDAVSVDGISAEWVAVPQTSLNQVILYLHGGSYLYGSLNTHRELVSRLSRASGSRVLHIAYRLAPENPFPAAVEDASTAYRWLLSRGVSPRRLIVAGDSAGGGLTLATLVALRDEKAAMPAAAVCLSPWTDLAGTGESLIHNADIDPMGNPEGLLREAKLYLGGADPNNPLASPLYADLRGLPPLLIQVGTREVLLDDSTRLAERASAVGVEVQLEVWEGMIHVWQAFASMLPEGRAAIDRIGDFVRRHTSG